MAQHLTNCHPRANSEQTLRPPLKTDGWYQFVCAPFTVRYSRTVNGTQTNSYQPIGFLLRDPDSCCLSSICCVSAPGQFCIAALYYTLCIVLYCIVSRHDDDDSSAVESIEATAAAASVVLHSSCLQKVENSTSKLQKRRA